MTVLDEAYQRLHGKGPEFGGDEEGNHGLTNHGPMAVEVMVRRGLDLNVHRWLDRYLDRLTDLPGTVDPITAHNWRAALGDPRRIGDWTAWFTRQLAEHPWRQVLATWWPRLLPGIIAGSTHGVIRVGHAVRALRAADDDRPAAAELGHGLAFWAARWRPLPGLGAPVPDLAEAAALTARAALAAVPRLADQSGLIAHRLTRLAELPGWPAALANLRPPAAPADVPVLLADLVEAAVLDYLGHGQASPVLLVHTATAPNAVRHVLPVLPTAMWVPSLTAVWSAGAAITAAYAPARPESPSAPQLGSDPVAEVLDLGARHGDEHVIKFADTALDVFDDTGDPRVLAAALHAARLIESP
ncbi:questin oxidase family protein [Lentzea sp. NPDC004782]|uniref:questin oxidase family protein n=1 Tax=Lentzea sp. NPDC004782 TaxID=3154458 RepID=UPI0033B14404